jgi:hypothetical protein
MSYSRKNKIRRTLLPRRARSAAALAGLLLAWTGAEPILGQTVEQPALAQEATGPATRPAMQKTYLNKGIIQLPIHIDERARAQVQEIQLFVKSPPATTWQKYAKAGWGQSAFTFTAPRDGEFWFAMVTVDQQGRPTPPDLNQEAPGLIVVVDRHAPQVDLLTLGTGPEGQLVQCEVHDDHLDPLKTRLHFQTGDKVFRQLEALPGRANVFCIPAQAVFTGMLRISAADLAGNVTSREIHMNQLQPAGNSGAGATPPKIGGLAEPNRLPAAMAAPLENDLSNEAGPVLVAQQFPNIQPGKPGTIIETKRVAATPAPHGQGPILPCPDCQANTSTMLPVLGASQGRTVAGIVPPFAETAGGATNKARREVVSQQRQLVNNPHVFLEYQIEQSGASGVGKVEVWLTRDQGQSWQRLCEDADRKSPVELDLPGEGLFGINLVISNGRGFGGTPPNPGDMPQWWIEVDTTRPKVEIVNATTVAEGGGALHVTWRATDKNLAADGIELYFATNRQGQWQPIAKGLHNDGQYRWTPPNDVGPQAYLRLCARDQAGNTAVTETPQPILLDDQSRPRAQILGASTNVSTRAGSN